MSPPVRVGTVYSSRSKTPLPSASHSMACTAPPASAAVAVAVTAAPGLTESGELGWVPLSEIEPDSDDAASLTTAFPTRHQPWLVPPTSGKLPFSLASWASTT